MKKTLLLILSVIIIISIVVLVICKKNKIDITDTWFDYDVKICDKYFELVECIIDKDANVNYTKEIRTELKGEIKQMQEGWKQLSEEELTKKCTEELAKLEPIEDEISAFGCSTK